MNKGTLKGGFSWIPACRAANAVITGLRADVANRRLHSLSDAAAFSGLHDPSGSAVKLDQARGYLDAFSDAVVHRPFKITVELCELSAGLAEGELFFSTLGALGWLVSLVCAPHMKMRSAWKDHQSLPRLASASRFASVGDQLNPCLSGFFASRVRFVIFASCCCLCHRCSRPKLLDRV